MAKSAAHGVGLVLAAVPFAIIGMAQEKPKPATSSEVLSIFKAHCVSCHTGKGASGGLDLTSVKTLLAGGASGKSVVAGIPEKSLLLDRILGKGGLPQMPMGFAPLSSAKVETIRSWIKAGALAEGSDKSSHWAYKMPVRPKLPTVQNKAWVLNPVDAFILSRLEKEKLSPSKPAGKERLLRRVYLDLLGLPPTPKEIDAFLADARPDAYERVVDRLLANPHFGERMARPWLDLARYADSDGYEKDLNRTAWLYRDWVIDAFNENKPYDLFTIEQLAGDLLPNSTVQQKVATGFNRNTMFNREGGVDQAEAYFNVLLDRVGTTSTVWLGSTMACARCHDHKYDPFSQKDFYKLYAYFGNGVVIPRGPKEVGEEKWFEPEIQVPSPDQSKKLAAWGSEVAVAKSELQHKFQAMEPNYVDWTQKAKSTVWRSLVPASVETSSGEKAQIDADGTVSLFTKTPKLSYTLTFKLDPGVWRGVRIQTVPDARLSNNGAGNADGGNFVMSEVTATEDGRPKNFAVAQADFVQAEFSSAGVLDGNVDTGWAVYPQPGKPHELGLAWKSPIDSSKPTELKLRIDCMSNRWPQHTIAKFRIAISQSDNPEQYVMPSEIRALVEKASRTANEEGSLRKHFETVSPALRQFRARVSELEDKIAQLKREIPTALVLQEKPVQGPLYASIYYRGEFLNPTDKVKAGTPDVFPELSGATSNRLGLARWIVSKSNPLTARVEVNRLWELVFGRGIVETSEDFGTQGSRPTHPELLDWLAVEFAEKGWNVKQMMRLLVTSNTYRQDSTVTQSLEARDPNNILLARAPRFRLEAESIRDVALAASGLLRPKVGGPSVYPYQPDGVWNVPYNGEAWMTSTGEDRYRRGLYTFIKRSSPYPSFLAFDATSRESCTVRRIRTNTPLQALALLNDRFSVESATALWKRMEREGGPDDRSKLIHGFRLCTSRKPTASETGLMLKLLEKMKSKYKRAPEEAKKLAGTPTDAAWTMVCNVLLNLDESITKE